MRHSGVLLRRAIARAFFALLLIAFTFSLPAFPQGNAASQTSVSHSDGDSADIPPFARDRIDEDTYLRLRDEQTAIRRGIPDLVHNPQARSRAIRQLEQQLLNQAAAAAAGLPGTATSIPAWTPLGPAPIPNGQTSPTEVPVSGRVTAIAVDPTNTDIVYVGAAQGGVYRSLDGGNTWTPLMDTAQSLAIGAITIDPTDRNTLFVGTGEGNLSIDSFFGVGLYIIRNATSQSPSLSGPFNKTDQGADILTGRSITQILVNPNDHNRILVSTSSGASGLSADTFSTLPTRGVYLSTNALSANPTFTRLTIQNTNIANRTVTDMALDPANPDHVLVNIFGLTNSGDGGVWVSTTGSPWNNSATWQQTFVPPSSSGSTQTPDNGKFAVNHTANGTSFLLTLDEVTSCGGRNVGGTVMRSTDGGLHWTELTAARGFCAGQCFYDAPVVMHPTDPNTIFIGGSADSSSSLVGACGSAIAGKSTDGGLTFTRKDDLLHADSHAFAFAPSNPQTIYTGNDGGIFRSDDGGATWKSLNTTGFNATQFESLSVHPSDGNFSIGGTQDNGTPFFQADGTWTRADFGDGGYSAIDQNASDTANVTMYHTYFNATNSLIGFGRVTSVSSATEGNWNFLGCNAPNSNNGITCSDSVLFYAPLALGPGNPNTFYFGTDRLYRSTNQGTAMSLVSQGPFAVNPNGGNFRVSAIGIAPQDDNVRLVGLENGKLVGTNNGSNPLTDITGPWSAKYIARAVIDPNNKNTAYITLDGYGFLSHIWKTTNLNVDLSTTARPTWSNASNGLPDVPVNAFAVDPFNSSYLYAGTDIGVFASTDGGATWAAYGTGLPRVAVFDLQIQKTTHKVRIGTHGRGAWEIAAQPFNDTVSVSSSLNNAPFGASVTFTATVDKGSGAPAPTGTVTFFDGTTPLGSAPLDNRAKATIQVSSLSVGSHSITAQYNGDSTYIATTSSVFTETVNPASTTLAVSSSKNPSAPGENVTFTATVSVTPPGAGSPSGAVQFAIDGTNFGPLITLSGNNATLSTSSLSAGTHSVTAEYSGDPNFVGSSGSLAGGQIVDNLPFGWIDGAVNASDGTTSIPQNGTLRASGWAADKEDGSPVARVDVLIDGSVVGHATLGGSRPDVATAFNDPRYTNCGWSFSGSIGTLSAGAHTVTAVAVDSQGLSTVLRGSKSITVTTANTAPFGWIDGAVNSSNGSTTIPQNGTLAASGWAADKEDGSPVALVQIVVDGNVVGNATMGFSRPDVATAYNDARYTNSGWRFSYNIGTLAVGTHTVTAVGVDSAGLRANLRGSKSITVTQ